jgi:crotonobetainyl-CoA:carnitine CoA-transferase CaiB-like acyl-CoA transferase
MIEDARFENQVARLMNKTALEDEIEAALMEQDTETWIELMRVEDIPCSPVNTLDQVLEDPQVKHNDIVLEMEHQEYGPMKAIGCPIKILGTCEGTNDAPPMLGEHTEEVLKTLLSYSDEKIAALKKEQEENVEVMKSHARKVLA